MSNETAFIILATLGALNMVATIVVGAIVAARMTSEHAITMDASHDGQMWLANVIRMYKGK